MKRILYPLLFALLIPFTTNAQSDPSLSGISLSYMPTSLTSNWFHTDSLNYDIALTYGAIIPHITAITTDVNASHQVFQNPTFMDSVTVLSADTTQSRTYTFNWIHDDPVNPVGMYLTDSTDLCNNYSPDSTTFYYLIDSTWMLPELPLENYGDNASITITNPTIAGPGMTLILTIESEDGSYFETYTFIFIPDCDVLFNDTLNIDENSALEMKIFPNPFNDIIQFDNANNLNELIIFDTSGKLVFRKELKENQKMIDLSIIESGIYILHLKGENGSKSFKVSKL